MEEINLRDLIKDYPDFPKQGIIFKDILPILANPESFAALIKKMASNDCIKRADALVGIDAREGFVSVEGWAKHSDMNILELRLKLFDTLQKVEKL